MFEQPIDRELKDELLRGDALEDIAMELDNTIPEETLYPHGCNCPYQSLDLMDSRKDMGHAEYVNEYSCETCGAKVTNSHPFKMDETYMA